MYFSEFLQSCVPIFIKIRGQFGTKGQFGTTVHIKETILQLDNLSQENTIKNFFCQNEQNLTQI